MSRLLHTVLIAALVVATSCSEPQQTAPADQDAQPPAAALTGADATPPIDPQFAPIATEFRSRLGRYKGTLDALTAADGKLMAEWTSQDCPMLEGEVIDFLISLHRGHPGSLTQDIEAQRRCDGSTRQFALPAPRFEAYRVGQLSDGEVLRGLR